MVLLFALMARCLGHEGLIGPYRGRAQWALGPYRPFSLGCFFVNLWLLCLPCRRGWGGVSLTLHLCGHWACSSCLVLPCWMARRLGHHGMYVTALRIHGIATRFDGKVPWTWRSHRALHRQEPMGPLALWALFFFWRGALDYCCSI